MTVHHAHRDRLRAGTGMATVGGETKRGAMTAPLTLNCACGAMTWRLRDGASGTHLRCYCRDCQSFANHVGHPEYLSPLGGSDIFQTLPRDIVFETGMDNLSLLRLGPKGLFRWYAGCCGTPIANTLTTPGFPFAGLILPQDATAFGPLVAEVNTTDTDPPVRQRGLPRVLLTVMGRGLWAKLTGKRQTPFFDDAGQPVRAPYVLSLEERNAARGV